MALVSGFEMCGIEYIQAIDECIEPFTRTGWIPFLEKFTIFNVEFTKACALSFNGEYTQVGDIDLHLIEEFVAQATKLPLDGERWFKGGRIKGRAWKQFLINSGQGVDSKFGFPVRLVKRY